MGNGNLRKSGIILLHGLVGWALCGAIMGVGMAVTTMQTTLIAHAVGAPVIFSMISYLYFTRFNFTAPAQTAGAFLLIVMAMDFFLVSMVINKSFEMFASLLGTWIPFVLIFLSTFMTGKVVISASREARTA